MSSKSDFSGSELLKSLRLSAAKEKRKEWEEEDDFNVATGIAFISALFTKSDVMVLLGGMHSPLLCRNTVHQISSCAGGNFSIHHTHSQLYLQAVSISVNNATTVIRGGVDWSYSRCFMESSGFGFHQGLPETTATYEALKRRLCAPIGNDAVFHDTLSDQHPCFMNIDCLMFLAKLITKTFMQWWNDDAPILRSFLICASNVSEADIRLDPLWGRIAGDGTIKCIEQVEPTEPPSAEVHNLTEVPIIAIPFDTWVSARIHSLSIPGWELNKWGGQVAVVPIETSMCRSYAVWMYIACFISTRLWNNRYLYKVTVSANPALSCLEDETREFHFWVRPRASLAEVGGPTQVMLVVTNMTSSNAPADLSVYNFSVPIVTTTKQFTAVDCYAELCNVLGLDKEHLRPDGIWMMVWNWLEQRIASGSGIQRAMALAAEVCGVISIDALNTYPDKAPGMWYGIKTKQNPPNIRGTSWTIRMWADIVHNAEAEETIGAWISDINDLCVSPFNLHASRYYKFGLWDKMDWVVSVNGFDSSLKCYEASPDMRIARFVGLLAASSSIGFTYVMTVRECIRATQAFIQAGVGWMQGAVGVSWILWALNYEVKNSSIQNSHQNSVISDCIEIASHGHVSLAGPGKYWSNVIQKFYTGMKANWCLAVGTLVPWWYIKFILQNVNYLIPGQLQFRLHIIGEADAVGLYVSKNAEWQASARVTSMLGMQNDLDVPVVATTQGKEYKLEYGIINISMVRYFAMAAEAFHDHEKIFVKDVCGILDSCCAFPNLAQDSVKQKRREMLITATKGDTGTGIGDQIITEEYHSSWWDWLLPGIKIAPSSMADESWLTDVSPMFAALLQRRI